MAAQADRIPPLKTALSCCCPRCGQGRLFDGFLSVAERCEACGLALGRHDSGDGPAVFLIFILGFIAVPIVLWIGFSFDLPSWAPAALGGVVVLGMALGLLRPAKAYMIALQYRHRREDFEAD